MIRTKIKSGTYDISSWSISEKATVKSDSPSAFKTKNEFDTFLSRELITEVDI